MHSTKTSFLVVLAILIALLPIGFSVPMLQTSVAAPPLSIILMVGDGMGSNQTHLARLVEYGNTANLSMEELPEHLTVTTYSNNNLITDSAAAATALATGSKTNNGMLAMAPNGTILETILEFVESKNMTSGIVVTSEVQHATPAAFMTHVSSRSNYPEITRQIVEESGVEVLMGGGRSYFTIEQLDVMKSRGFALVENRTSLLSVTDGKLLGLFADGHLPYEMDRNLSSVPSLAEMTDKALDIIDDTDNGFFLMVEGSRIDHAGHANDAVRMALEAIAFDDAVKRASDYVSANPNAMLIVTADHETGGFSIISSSLSDTLPENAPSEEERRNLRIARAQNVSVSWSTGYHTATNVPCYVLRPDKFRFQDETIIDNTDIYGMMKSYLETPIPTTSISTSLTNQTSTSSTTITSSPTSTTSAPPTSEPLNPPAASDAPPITPVIITVTLILGASTVLVFVFFRFKRKR